MTRISTARLYLAAIALPLVAPGCVLGSPSNRGSDSSTGTASTSTAGATSTSDTSHPTSSGDSDSEASTSTNDLSSGATFILPADLNGVEPCDPISQDCPPGQKCMPYADNGGSSWNDTKCAPIMGNPAGVGEPCFVVDNGFSGIDNCELGAMCWDVDPDNNGVCIAMCTGSESLLTCPQGYTCAFSRGVGFGLCKPACDPLAQDCDPGDVCIHNPSAQEFICILDASGRDGQLHDLCNFANACDPGLWCADPTDAKECDPRELGCCEPFCDLTAPNTCPGEDQLCVPYYDPEPAPPGYEKVGRCTLPN